MKVSHFAMISLALASAACGMARPGTGVMVVDASGVYKVREPPADRDDQDFVCGTNVVGLPDVIAQIVGDPKSDPREVEEAMPDWFEISTTWQTLEGTGTPPDPRFRKLELTQSWTDEGLKWTFVLQASKQLTDEEIKDIYRDRKLAKLVRDWKSSTRQCKKAVKRSE
jgi:hypothetical protein